MMNPHYPECRALPAINETFPQFSHHRPAIALLSPLDLSLRAANIIPITPPSTPSPPRKRLRLMSEENYLWRPHAMAPVTATPTQAPPHAALAMQLLAATSATSSAAPSMSYLHHHQQQQQQQEQQQQLGSSCYGLRFDGGGSAAYNKSHFYETKSNIQEIPASQSSVQQQPAIAPAPTSTQPIIYVDDETIVLTEDEDETVVSSHDYNEDTDVEDGTEDAVASVVDAEQLELRFKTSSETCHEEDDIEGDDENDNDEEEEEIYVDVLSNDDDNDDLQNPSQRLQAQLAVGKALKRNELQYEDEELHHQAVDGLDRLFDRNFAQPPTAVSIDGEKIYMDLSGGENVVRQQSPLAKLPALPPPPQPLPQRIQKPERKRSKLRKHTAIDEETISPVSGTIIRKLRDDEELVVRKGDIDPAFNVVEITEEAKASLASIENKIGDYLCQLCRTLYDDAFMLAQHRCPRIVHIEYKCSECEKVFNCPANLASHRRWHKPKSELLANSQNKKRQSEAVNSGSSNQVAEKSVTEDATEGIYPCHQCGKTFRRHAYLKKHLASHQMLENLKNMDFFKAHSHQQPSANFPNPPPAQPAYPLFTGSGAAINANSATQLPRPPGVLYPTPKNYAQRYAGFPFQPFDQRRFYSLGELYLSQHLERSSAFQYVQANHLMQLSNAANNLMPRVAAAAPLPVK